MSTATRLGAVLWLVTATGCASFAPAPAPLPNETRGVAPAEPTAELEFLIGHRLELDGQPAEALAAYERALSLDPESVYLLKRVAELSARQNKLEEALGYGERVLALDPDDRGVRLFLGTLYRFRRDIDAVERVLLTEDGEPIGSDAAILLYGVYGDLRRLDDAREAAEWMIAEDPDGLRGYLALADIRERLDDPSGAERALRDGLERNPDELALYSALARGRRDRGDRVGELGIYREVLAVHPDHHGTLLQKADAEIALGREDEARRTLEQVEESHPRDLRTLLRLAFLDFEADALDAAQARFERALELQPEQYEVVYFLGVSQRRQARIDDARATFERIPEAHERYPDARTQLAGMHERDGEIDAAIAEVERARSIAPSRPLDLYRASLQAKSGDPEGALAFLEELLAESPDDVEILYNIGVIHGEAQDVEAAIRTMELVLERNPDHAGALNYVGYTLAERGTDLDEAEAMVARALELRPDDGYITDSLGWIYYQKARPLFAEGRTEEANEALDRAVEELTRAADLAPGDPVITEHLGDALLLSGDREGALEMYEEAVRLVPRIEEQPELFDKLEQLRRELGHGSGR